MKQIFKIASLLLVAGSVVLYTGCTKDYGTDVSELNEKVDALELIVAGQSEQIETLETLVSSLQSIQKTLQDDVAALQTAKTNLEAQIAQKADKTEVAELQTKIDEIDKSIAALQKLADDNAKNIEALQSQIANKADKSWVEQTYATITWVKEIENNLGSLKSTVDNITGVVIPEIQTNIKNAADSAAKALGEIEVIKGWFKNYYTAAEVDQKLSDLKGVIDSTISAEVAELQKKDNELKELIDKQDGLINQLIANKADKTDLEKLEKKLQAEIDAKADTSTVNSLQKQIDAINSVLAEKADTSTVNALARELEALQKKVDESITPDVQELLAKINSYGAKIDALATRVTSLSVCPTLNEEIIAFKYGNDVARMMRVTIAVTPADAINYICANKDSLHLIYAQGYQRTKSNVEYKEAKILSATAKDNSIVILADSVYVDEIASEHKIGTFFAAGWGDVDAAGKTRVISDFAQAVEGEFDIADKECFKYAYLSKSDTTDHKIKWVNRDSLTTESSYDYKQAATAKEKPFTDYFVAYDNSVNVPDDVRLMLPEGSYTLYQLSQLLNCDFVASETVTEVEPAKIVEDKGFETEYNFVPAAAKGLNDYVRDEPYTVTLQGMVNGKPVTYASSSRTVNHNFYFTPLDKGLFDLGTARVYWNWKTYYAKDRKAVLDPTTNQNESVKEAWLAAREANCKVAEKLGNGSGTGLEYAAWNGNDSTLSYYPDITLSLLADVYDSTAMFANVKDTIKKQNDTVMYKFAFETIVDTPCQDQTVNFSTKVRGSVTLADTIAVPNFLSSVLAEKPGDEHKVKSIFINGLSGTDVLWTNIYEKAKDRLRIADNVTVVDDSTGRSYEIKRAQLGQLVESDTFYFIVPAGTWKYNEKRNVTCTVNDLFGFKYEVKVSVETGAPKFSLAYNKKYVKDTTATTGILEVRGKIGGNNTVGRYTIEEMHYANYWKLVGDFSDEDKDAIFKLCFDNCYVPADEWGTGEGLSGKIAYEDVTFSDHQLLYKDAMTWNSATQIKENNNYKATYFYMSPKLKVSTKDETVVVDFSNFSTTVNKAIKFYTREPLKFSDTSYVIEKTREAGKNLDFYYYAPVKVNGFYDNGQGGAWTTTNLYVNGEFGTDESKNQVYDGAEVKYIIPDEITTDDGKYVLKRGQDYQLNEDEQKLWILAESAIAEDYSFTIKAELHNALDHLSYDGVLSNEFKEEAVKKANVKISVKQN